MISDCSDSDTKRSTDQPPSSRPVRVTAGIGGAAAPSVQRSRSPSPRPRPVAPRDEVDASAIAVGTLGAGGRASQAMEPEGTSSPHVAAATSFGARAFGHASRSSRASLLAALRHTPPQQPHAAAAAARRGAPAHKRAASADVATAAKRNRAPVCSAAAAEDAVSDNSTAAVHAHRRDVRCDQPANARSAGAALQDGAAPAVYSAAAGTTAAVSDSHPPPCSRGSADSQWPRIDVPHDMYSAATGSHPAASGPHPVLRSGPAGVGQRRGRGCDDSAAVGPARRRLVGKQRPQQAAVDRACSYDARPIGHTSTPADQPMQPAEHPAQRGLALAGRPPERAGARVVGLATWW